MQYECSMDSTLFEYWFEYQLLPAVSEDSVIIMDNASFHRKNKLCSIIFLPPYSPELNPIEKLWANLKRWLKFNLCFFDIFDDAVSFYFQVN